MDLCEITVSDFDLTQIARSGQCFRMTDLGDGIWAAAAGDHYVQVLQKGRRCSFSCRKEEFETIWKDYFDLDTDYGRIKAMADPSDAYMKAAMEFGGGIRVLRQDPWEVILTFLISQNNNIARITGSTAALCKKFGEKKKACFRFAMDGALDNGFFYAFPSPEAVVSQGLSGLSGLGLGYRDKYLYAMAERCAGEAGREWLHQLSLADYGKARQMLLEQFGVGQKVADCICLFGLHHVEAFPVDTHIRQILETYYPDGFPYERYKGAAGIIQQYLFYYKLRFPSGTIEP